MILKPENLLEMYKIKFIHSLLLQFWLTCQQIKKFFPTVSFDKLQKDVLSVATKTQTESVGSILISLRICNMRNPGRSQWH